MCRAMRPKVASSPSIIQFARAMLQTRRTIPASTRPARIRWRVEPRGMRPAGGEGAVASAGGPAVPVVSLGFRACGPSRMPRPRSRCGAWLVAAVHTADDAQPVEQLHQGGEEPSDVGQRRRVEHLTVLLILGSV